MTQDPFNHSSNKKIGNTLKKILLQFEYVANFFDYSEPFDWVKAVPVLRVATKTILYTFSHFIPISVHVNEFGTGLMDAQCFPSDDMFGHLLNIDFIKYRENRFSIWEIIFSRLKGLRCFLAPDIKILVVQIEFSRLVQCNLIDTTLLIWKKVKQKCCPWSSTACQINYYFWACRFNFSKRKFSKVSS